MKNLKRILAWIGIILLLGLYVVTFILGITGNASTKGMLMAAIACTVVVPCLMYVMLLLARVLGRKQNPDVPPVKNAGEEKKQDD